jgi:hypothetical protein
MLLTDWNIINTEGRIIGRVTTSHNNSKAASEKVRFKYKSLSVFLRIEKDLDREM